jgi:hypothetical protein
VPLTLFPSGSDNASTSNGSFVFGWFGADSSELGVLGEGATAIADSELALRTGSVDAGLGDAGSVGREPHARTRPQAIASCHEFDTHLPL